MHTSTTSNQSTSDVNTSANDIVVTNNNDNHDMEIDNTEDLQSHHNTTCFDINRDREEIQPNISIYDESDIHIVVNANDRFIFVSQNEYNSFDIHNKIIYLMEIKIDYYDQPQYRYAIEDSRFVSNLKFNAAQQASTNALILQSELLNNDMGHESEY